MWQTVESETPTLKRRKVNDSYPLSLEKQTITGFFRIGSLVQQNMRHVVAAHKGAPSTATGTGLDKRPKGHQSAPQPRSTKRRKNTASRRIQLLDLVLKKRVHLRELFAVRRTVNFQVYWDEKEYCLSAGEGQRLPWQVSFKGGKREIRFKDFFLEQQQRSKICCSFFFSNT